MVATVIPDPGLMPNDPSTAKPITFPRIIGADFTPADKPAVTATQVSYFLTYQSPACFTNLL